jgi:hypothetical protein
MPPATRGKTFEKVFPLDSLSKLFIAPSAGASVRGEFSFKKQLQVKRSNLTSHPILREAAQKV